MRKAMALGKLISAIAILSALLILLVFVVKVRFATSNMIEDSKCSGSIINHVNLLKATGEASMTDITCPTQYYTIGSVSDDAKKRALADAMKTCWGTWGQGKLQLFDRDNVYCHVCSVVDFKSKGDKIEGLPEYLATAKIRQGKEIGQVYGKYLSFYSTEASDGTMKSAQELQQYRPSTQIDTSKPYAVMFVYVKGNNTMKEFLTKIDGLNMGATGGGIIAGGVLGGGAAVGTIWILSHFAGGAGFIADATILATGVVAGGSLGGIFGYEKANNLDWMSLTVLRQYDAKELTDLGCKVAPVLQDNQQAKLG
jgi:hypothetical protein